MFHLISFINRYIVAHGCCLLASQPVIRLLQESHCLLWMITLCSSLLSNQINLAHSIYASLDSFQQLSIVIYAETNKYNCEDFKPTILIPIKHVWSSQTFLHCRLFHSVFLHQLLWQFMRVPSYHTKCLRFESYWVTTWTYSICPRQMRQHIQRHPAISGMNETTELQGSWAYYFLH